MIENSPSLWPTMSSVTKTSVKLRPLWTWNVWPTNSGTMVQDRAHVRMGRQLVHIVLKHDLPVQLLVDVWSLFQ